MPRKAYKSLYLRERNARVEAEQTAFALRRELKRIRGVLADYAERELVPQLNEACDIIPKDKPIELYPIGMEGVKALMISTSRFSSDEDPDSVNIANYAWRGRKLICR